MSRLKLIFVLAVSSLLVGCFTPSPIAKLEAYSRLSPVLTAIEEFKTKNGRVPASLEELQTATARTFTLENPGAARVWSITYKPKGANSYDLSYNHAHYDLHYTDGRQTDWTFNPWR